jgi:hypothetical protein
LNTFINTGTGTDQAAFSFTNPVSVASVNSTLTTTWQRFTATGTIPTNATQMSFVVVFTPTGTASTNDYYEITGVQIDIGSVALPFRTYAGTIQGELAACQRYYYRASANASENYTYFGFGVASSTTNVKAIVQAKASLRTYPTAVDYGGTIILTTGDGSNYTVTSITVDAYSSQFPSFNFVVSSGLTAARPYNVRAEASSTAYIGYSAEL